MPSARQPLLHPNVAGVHVLSIVARVPLAMLSIGVLVHALHLTGSFAAAGVVSGAYAGALGVGAPLLGRIVDRRGQTAVLLAAAGTCMAALGVLAGLPRGAPIASILPLAVLAGLTTPPVGACLRGLVPQLLPDPAAARRVYALDATAVELTWISGPPLALGLAALWSTAIAIALSGLVQLAATAAFAAHPASRRWRPARVESVRRGALRAPAMRTLVAVLAGFGILLGAVDVGVASAVTTLGHPNTLGVLVGLWGAGSLVGGALTIRLGGGARGPAGLALVLAALAAGHLALALATGSVLALACLLVVAGAAIAPTYASVHVMVERAAPAGAVTEAFSWLQTATAVGASAGGAVAGAVADHAGSWAVFVVAGGAGVAASLTVLARARTLAPSGIRGEAGDRGMPPNCRHSLEAGRAPA